MEAEVCFYYLSTFFYYFLVMSEFWARMSFIAHHQIWICKLYISYLLEILFSQPWAPRGCSVLHHLSRQLSSRWWPELGEVWFLLSEELLQMPEFSPYADIATITDTDGIVMYAKIRFLNQNYFRSNRIKTQCVFYTYLPYQKTSHRNNSQTSKMQFKRPSLRITMKR